MGPLWWWSWWWRSYCTSRIPPEQDARFHTHEIIPGPAYDIMLSSETYHAVKHMLSCCQLSKPMCTPEPRPIAARRAQSAHMSLVQAQPGMRKPMCTPSFFSRVNATGKTVWGKRTNRGYKILKYLCFRRCVDIWPYCFVHFSAFSLIGWGWLQGGGMLTFLELAHATHAMVLRAHALHATPMLTYLEFAHATHAMVLRAHALHATPMLTFLDLAHATHAMVLRAHALHATPMLTFLDLAHATHAMVLRAHALHATPMLTFLDLAHATHAMALRAHALHATPMSTFLELAHAFADKVRRPPCPKKGVANSTCENTIAVGSTNHKISLQGHGLLPTCDLVLGSICLLRAWGNKGDKILI